jgi:unsaturated rhamnogalacturonyl hydrolase
MQMKQLTLSAFLFISTLVVHGQENVWSKKYIRSLMPKVAAWQFVHSNGKPENTWTNAAFYTGVYAAYTVTKDKTLLDSLMAIGQRNQWQPAKRYDHADDIAISQTYIDLYRIAGKQNMIQGTIDTVNRLKTTPGMQVSNKGITWWWCDALFMAPPTLAKLAKTLNDPSYLQLNDSLFRQCYDLLYDKEEKLFARDATYLIDAQGNGKREANGKKIFWARGNGWVVAGLARMLGEMPKDHPTRSFYTSLFRDIMTRLLELQQPDGLWRTSLLDPAQYPGGEGSGSAFNCYALAWGINQKILDKKTFLPATVRAWEALNTLVKPDGKVGWVQPIGADPKKNFNENSWEAYGAGAFLLAASEILRLKK